MKHPTIFHPIFPVSSFLAVAAGFVFLAELFSDWKADYDALKGLEEIPST